MLRAIGCLRRLMSARWVMTLSERILRLQVPDDEVLIAGVAVRLRDDETFTVQEYRRQEMLSGRDMARLLRELATSLELEADFDE
jgi:hypothetical protein